MRLAVPGVRAVINGVSAITEFDSGQGTVNRFMVNLIPMTTWRQRRVLGVMVVLGISACGCTVFNPAFVALVNPAAGAAGVTVDNAPGHVVMQFVNNAQVDERLISYLRGEGGLMLTDAQVRGLRPRVRLRMLITYTNGQSLPFEIVDGSQVLIDSRFQAAAEADINKNDLDNAVARCDVARVEIAPGSSIEVFIPVELLQFERQAVSIGNSVLIQFVPRERIPPQFRTLQPDQIDADGNVVLQANIGIRDFPAPVINPICGTVVAIIMNGTLRVPFLNNVQVPGSEGVIDDPSFDIGDAPSVAAIGGRYEFLVTVVGR